MGFLLGLILGFVGGYLYRKKVVVTINYIRNDEETEEEE